MVQDTLVLAWRKRELFDPERGTERQWLFGILRNVSASRFRTSQRGLQLVHSTNERRATIDLDNLDDSLVECAYVADALMALHQHHREVIVAAYYGGLLIRQIADRFDLPEGTVKSRLYYGLRRLRAELEEREILE